MKITSSPKLLANLGVKVELEAALMRLFVVLDIDDGIRGRLAFSTAVRGILSRCALGAFRIAARHLEVHRRKARRETEKIKRTLQTIVADSFEINFRGYGFFPGARAPPRVFWAGLRCGTKSVFLAARVDESLTMAGASRKRSTLSLRILRWRGVEEARAHRASRKATSRTGAFSSCRRNWRPCLAPEFGTMTIREFFLYRSQLSPGGSKYTKLAGFSLR